MNYYNENAVEQWQTDIADWPVFSDLPAAEQVAMIVAVWAEEPGAVDAMFRANVRLVLAVLDAPRSGLDPLGSDKRMSYRRVAQGARGREAFDLKMAGMPQGGVGVAVMDLIQAGNEALLRAIVTWQPGAGRNWGAWAWLLIERAMIDLLRPSKRTGSYDAPLDKTKGAGEAGAAPAGVGVRQSDLIASLGAEDCFEDLFDQIETADHMSVVTQALAFLSEDEALVVRYRWGIPDPADAECGVTTPMTWGQVRIFTGWRKARVHSTYNGAIEKLRAALASLSGREPV